MKPGKNQNNISGKTIAAFMLLVALLAASCEEDPTTIGLNLLPGKDFIDLRATDTISVSAFTMYESSVKSSNLAYQYLGKVYDPYFGTIQAGFVTQLRLLAKWDETPITIDSIMLNISIIAAKGDTLNTQTLRLFETAEVIYPDSTYYSGRNVQVVSEIASFTMPVLKGDSLLSFRLPDAFGDYIMRDTSKLFHSAKDPDFRDFFRGIYFTLDDSPNPVIYSLNLSSGATFIDLHYRDSSDIARNYYFIINERSARYNTYLHDFDAADPLKKITHLNDGIQDTLSYLQAVDGAYTRIKIPGLAAYRDSSGISVNKARLIIPVYYDETLYTEDNNVPQILLTYRNADGDKTVVHDYQVNSAFMDGTYDSDLKAYVFNIPTFVQKYLRGDVIAPEMDLYIPVGSWNNTIFKTPKNSNGIKFEFTYSWF